jgi:protein TonB
MKLLLALFLLNITSCVVWAQKTETDKSNRTIEIAAPPAIDESDSNAVYTVVEEPPEYRGGYNKMRTDLSQYIIYPEKARKDSVQGTVYVQFVVGKDGSLSNIVVIKGVNEEIDKAAINAVKSFPSWIPGKQRGKPVNVRFILPVKFSLKPPPK